MERSIVKRGKATDLYTKLLSLNPLRLKIESLPDLTPLHIMQWEEAIESMEDREGYRDALSDLREAFISHRALFEDDADAPATFDELQAKVKEAEQGKTSKKPSSGGAPAAAEPATEDSEETEVVELDDPLFETVNVGIITLTRRQYVEAGAEEVLRATMEHGRMPPSVLVNFKGVGNISSAFLTALIDLARRCNENEGGVVLFNVEPAVKPMFELIRRDDLLAEAESLEEAIAYAQRKWGHAPGD
ncbi:MAG: STAS domain-containing protein [Phycisphaeraceae bacterium]|nr:STAS domain-containing protein [Phycisphaeraceae bacterium]